MITGFNTDISYDGITYHVQTEDKGAENPMILSLVYVRGAILAAKRTSYAKEVEKGITESELQSLLEKQHRTILAVIKAGRIQELVDKLNKRPADEVEAIKPAAVAPPLPTPPPVPVPPIPAPLPVPVVPVTPVATPAQPIVTTPPIVPSPVNAPTTPTGQNRTQPPETQSQSLFIPPVPSSYRNSGNAEVSHRGDAQPLFAEFDLDKIIFDYLQSDAQEEKVEIRLRGNLEFFAGEGVLLQIEVTRGGIQPLASVPVIVKIIGTSFKPQIYSGRTGADGMAVIPITLPNFTAGSAAIVVQSSSDFGEAEIKQLIRRR